MAKKTLWISEYSDAPKLISAIPLPYGKEKADRRQVIEYDVSTQCEPFKDTTTTIRVMSDADCYLEFGENPVATKDSMPLPKDQPEYFGITQLQILAVYDGKS